MGSGCRSGQRHHPDLLSETKDHLSSRSLVAPRQVTNELGEQDISIGGKEREPLVRHTSIAAESAYGSIPPRDSETSILHQRRLDLCPGAQLLELPGIHIGNPETADLPLAGDQGVA